MQTSKLRAIGLLITLLTCFSLWAKKGVESVQMDYVALDTSVECNRIFFRSSQTFQNTIFMVPRPIMGTGIAGAKTYHLSRLSHGKYQLKVNFYFSRSDEVISSNLAHLAKPNSQHCNYDSVKESLNENIQDERLKITTIAKIPVNGIQINIDGIKATSYSGKNPESNEALDIYEYDGKVITAVFEITEAEGLYFQSNLISSEGINARIKFHFQARSRESSITASVNSESLIQNFNAQVKSSKKMKFITSAQLKTFLQNSVDDKSVKIVSQNANTESLAKITQMITDKVLGEISFADSRKSLPNTSGKDVSADQVDIDLVLNILKTKINQSYVFDFISAPESSAAQIDMKLQADRLNDPNQAELRLTAGNGDPMTSIMVMKNQQFVISFPYWYREDISYDGAKINYLMLTDIMKKYRLYNYFKHLSSENMKIVNTKVNGLSFAQGRYTPLSSINSLPTPYLYRWKMKELQPDVKRTASGGFSDLTLEKLSRLPIFISFSNFSDSTMIKLSDLVKPNDFVQASFNEKTRQLVLTARQDLGTLRFRTRFSSEEFIIKSKIPQPITTFIEEETNLLTEKTSVSAGYVTKFDPNPVIMQKTIALNISRPQTVQQQPQLASGSATATMKSKLLLIVEPAPTENIIVPVIP